MGNAPIIAAIGNHDAGQYFHAPRDNAVFYTKYFPAAVGMQAIAPIDRPTYHRHQIGYCFGLVSCMKMTYLFRPNFSITVLDSAVVVPVEGDQVRALSRSTTHT
jgi:hypothetical protein